MADSSLSVDDLPALLRELGELVRIDGSTPSPHARRTAATLGRRIAELFTLTKYPGGMPLDIAERAAARADCDPNLLHALEQSARACGRIAAQRVAPGDPPVAEQLFTLAARLERITRPASGNEFDHAVDWAARELAVENDTADATRAESAKQTETAHSEDFRSVRWFGETYSFTAKQAPVVRLLWEHWAKGTPDVGDETLLLAVDHEWPPASIRHLFRGHPAWKTLIIAGANRGTHRLADPKKI
jgi:hypothetical protein